jgi:hypothetical protein
MTGQEWFLVSCVVVAALALAAMPIVMTFWRR